MSTPQSWKHLRPRQYSGSVSQIPQMSMPAAATEEIHGKLSDGREVRIFTLTNGHGLRARISEYGAILTSFDAPDADGNLADLTHGFDTLENWVGNNDPCFGATVGRYGNRIAAGQFTLDGQDYQLLTNNAPGGIPCALHGGEKGFHKVLWQGQLLDERTVALRYTSKAGEEGYPGTLEVQVTYCLSEDNQLTWEATATTDAPTVLNLLHHSYWNLSGDPTTRVLDHQLHLNATHYLPTNEGLIPTGELASVADTPMDFTQARAIGEGLDANFEALRHGHGYDHCWALRPSENIQLAARVTDPKSGRIMEIHTNQPGIQFYAANFLDGTIVGKGGIAYQRHSALCLETQNFPDAPNQSSFPSPVLRPGESYRHVMVHRFFNV